MPMETIENVYITQFSDNLHIEAQQTIARTRPYVMMKRLEAEKFYYDGLGSIRSREIQGRHVAVAFDDIEFRRRKINKRRFAVTVPVDKEDVRSMLTDPQSDLAKACVAEMERVFDRIVVEAALATVYTGKDATTAVTATSDGVVTVNATAGLTYDKLLEIQKNWIDNEVGNEGMTDTVLMISGDEHSALMGETKLISGDYTRQFAVEKGRIQTALGMDLIKFGASVQEPILSVSGGVRSCIAMAKNAVCVGIAKNWDVKVQERTDLYETWQIQVTGTLGAVRTEGVLVQKVTTTD